MILWFIVIPYKFEHYKPVTLWVNVEGKLLRAHVSKTMFNLGVVFVRCASSLDPEMGNINLIPGQIQFRYMFLCRLQPMRVYGLGFK